MEPYAHTPPTQLNIGKCRVAVTDPDTPGLVLLVIAMWAFGPYVLGDPEEGIEAMDPSELWAGMNETFGGWVSEEGENRLNALILALQGDLFYRDVDVFTSVCGALLDGDLGDMVNGDFAELTSAEIMWGVLEVELAREDEDGPPHFSYGVRDIISKSLADEQEDDSLLQSEIRRNYDDMITLMREIGVPLASLRLFDAEYVETYEAMMAVGA